MDRQYWDLELKDQSKKRMALVTAAIAQLNAIIHDCHKENFFEGKQSWRNPLLLRISLPKGKKYEFILTTKLNCWLFEPPRVNGDLSREQKLELRGRHDELRFKPVRTYRLHPVDRAYVRNYRNNLILDGAENVSRVLNGELDLVNSDRFVP